MGETSRRVRGEVRKARQKGAGEDGREQRQPARARGGGRGGRRAENISFLGSFLPALMMISQLILLSQNLSYKKDSVKTAAMAAKDCVIRENYQVVSGEWKGLFREGSACSGVGPALHLSTHRDACSGYLSPPSHLHSLFLLAWVRMTGELGCRGPLQVEVWWGARVSPHGGQKPEHGQAVCRTPRGGRGATTTEAWLWRRAWKKAIEMALRGHHDLLKGVSEPGVGAGT